MILNLLTSLLLCAGCVLNEVIEIQNLALYHVTPESDAQLRFLNRMRTSDSGMVFINGVGIVGETVEIMASPQVMDFYDRELEDLKLDYDMKFNPVSIEMYENDTRVEPEEEERPPLPSKRNLMPIETIAPPVYSGIFLKIAPSMSPDVSVLSYSTQINSTMGNPYLCFSTEKNHQVSDNAQWIFEDTEIDGYYVLRNRKLPNGYVTWEDDEEPFLVIETRLEFQRKYQFEGKLRKNVLFKITPATKSDTKGRLFEMVIMGRDQQDLNIVVNTEFATTHGCLYLRRGNKDVDVDDMKNDFLFRISPPRGTLKIMGYMEDFRFSATVPDLYARSRKEDTIKSLTTKKVFNHGEQVLKLTVEDVHERLDKFHLTFPTSMDAFQMLWVPPGLSLGVPLTTMDERHKMGMHASIRLNQAPGKDTVAKIKYLVSGDIEVPPWSSAEYSIMFGWLNKLELDFEATLRIVGKADRMTQTRKPKLVPDQPVNFFMLKEILRERGFKIGTSLTSANPDDMEAMSFEMPIKGLLTAVTLGVKGEVEMTVKQLAREVNATCDVPEH